MKNLINKTWHEKNKMPMPTTLQQRVKWHEQHLKHCNCRKDLPKTIIVALKEQGKKICKNSHIYKGPNKCPVCGSL